MTDPPNTVVVRFPTIWLVALLVPLAFSLHEVARIVIEHAPRAGCDTMAMRDAVIWGNAVIIAAAFMLVARARPSLLDRLLAEKGARK